MTNHVKALSHNTVIAHDCTPSRYDLRCLKAMPKPKQKHDCTLNVCFIDDEIGYV